MQIAAEFLHQLDLIAVGIGDVGRAGFLPWDHLAVVQLDLPIAQFLQRQIEIVEVEPEVVDCAAAPWRLIFSVSAIACCKNGLLSLRIKSVLVRGLACKR